MVRVLTDRDAGDETPCLRDLAVVSWRYERMSSAGYPPDVAVALAERADVDLHDAVELLEHGCPVTDAIRILM